MNKCGKWHTKHMAADEHNHIAAFEQWNFVIDNFTSCCNICYGMCNATIDALITFK